MKLPCELIIWYILPSIRKEVAKCLIKEHGFTQAKVARKLGISEAAVSQYLSAKRGQTKICNKKVLKQIKKSAGRIASGDKTVMFIELCKICEVIRTTEIISDIYKTNFGETMPTGVLCPSFRSDLNDDETSQ